MALRIAFDLDGVLADMDGELGRHAAALFGESEAIGTRPASSTAPGMPPPAPGTAPSAPPPARGAAPSTPNPAPGTRQGLASSDLKLSARQQRRLWQHVASIENFWGTLQEIEPGATERLAAVAGERQWEVIFLTRRPESAGETAQRQTQRWLEAKGFPLPSVFVVQGSRGRIASALALDIVVDDRLENCLDVVADSKARAILVWRAAEDQLPATAKRLGIGVVRSVSECLEILTEVDAPTANRAGVVARVMRALGLKEPAGA